MPRMGREGEGGRRSGQGDRRVGAIFAMKKTWLEKNGCKNARLESRFGFDIRQTLTQAKKKAS